MNRTGKGITWSQGVSEIKDITKKLYRTRGKTQQGSVNGFWPGQERREKIETMKGLAMYHLGNS